jgi:hypothetical protein
VQYLAALCKKGEDNRITWNLEDWRRNRKTREAFIWREQATGTCKHTPARFMMIVFSPLVPSVTVF